MPAPPPIQSLHEAPPAGPYRAAGVRIDSAIPLVGLEPAGDAGPLAIAIREAPFASDDSAWTLTDQQGGDGGPFDQRRWVADRPDGRWFRFRFDYREHALELVLTPDGGEILVARTPLVSDTDAAAFLAGPFLGRALRLRGVPCLHATAVRVDGRAIAILGDSGVGKSTLAAALVAGGCALVSDDMVACVPAAESFHVLRGPRRMRLWKDAAARWSAGGEVRPIWAGIPELEKLVVAPRAPEREVPAALPLAGLYLLRRGDPGSEPTIASLDPTERVAAITGHMYGALTPPEAVRLRELAFAQRLAAAVPVTCLTLPHDHDLDAVDRAAARVLEHARGGRSE